MGFLQKFFLQNLVEDSQDEEIVLEPVVEKQIGQLSILDFFKK